MKITVAMFIESAKMDLRNAHPDECRLLAELLTSRALGCPRLELPLHYNEILPVSTLNSLRADKDSLAAGMPWQYLTGATEFMGREFTCDTRALIPRPETELFVEWILNAPTVRRMRNARVAEVGTGTGCIIITLALERPDFICRATDISHPALTLARENAKSHGVADRIQFQHADLLTGIPKNSQDIITANPPYVTTREWRELPVHIRDHEPATALEAGLDGMQVAVRLVPQTVDTLKPGGWLFIEFAPARIAQLHRLMYDSGLQNIITGADYTGRAHFIAGQAQ